jgi:serine/threonine protein kinase
MSLEYCQKGDLFDFIKHKSKGSLSPTLANALFHEILDAVDSLHNKAGVAHLDLKLENILLTEDFRIKLCDFGFSQSVHNRIFKSVGTDGYKAPEIYKITNHHPN